MRVVIILRRASTFSCRFESSRLKKIPRTVTRRIGENQPSDVFKYDDRLWRFGTSIQKCANFTQMDELWVDTKPVVTSKVIDGY
jgi:hypothetical protein